MSGFAIGRAVLTLTLVIAFLKAAESLVSQSQLDAIQRYCDDLTLRLNETRPLRALDRLTGRRTRSILLLMLTAAFVGCLCHQISTSLFSQHSNHGGLINTTALAALGLILIPSLFAIWFFGKPIGDWLHADGDYCKFTARGFWFVLGLPVLVLLAGNLSVELARHATHLSFALGWFADAGSVVLGTVAAALLGLWWTGTITAYANWALAAALYGVHGGVRAFEWIMWRISLSAKGAWSAICALIALAATAAQICLQTH